MWLDLAATSRLGSILVWNIYSFRFPGRAAMRRSAAAVALFVVALVLVAGALASGAHRSSPTKLTIWVGWSAGKELTTFKAVAAEYDKNHPEVTIKVVGGIDDNK